MEGDPRGVAHARVEYQAPMFPLPQSKVPLLTQGSPRFGRPVCAW